MIKLPYVFFGLLMLCNITANFLEKKGMTMLPKMTSFSQLFSIGTAKAIITNPYIVAGVGLSVVGIMLWLGSLSSFKLSYLVPLAGLSYILTALASWWILGERISPIQWGGIVVIVIGVYLLNQK